MKTVALILLVLLAGLVVAHLVANARFAARARALAATLETGAPMSSADPPPAIRAFAERNGGGRGGPYRALRLTQEAQMQVAPGRGFSPAPATQTVGLGASGFVWTAESPGWPVPRARVIDAFVEGRGMFLVRILGSLPVVTATGPIYDRAEAMRYLAELPWAPDAILGNPEIRWTERPDGWIEAALDLPGGAAAVRFRLDGGDIVEMHADGRPDLDANGTEISRIWQARFSDYQEIGGRRIPLSGEVGYVTGGVYEPYFRGRVTSYELLR